MCVCDLAGGIVAANQAWHKYLAWDIDDLKSQPWLALVHPQDLTIAKKGWSELVDRSTRPAQGHIGSGLKRLDYTNSNHQNSLIKFSPIDPPSENQQTKQISRFQVHMHSQSGESVLVQWRFSIAPDHTVCGLGEIIDASLLPAQNPDLDMAQADQIPGYSNNGANCFASNGGPLDLDDELTVNNVNKHNPNRQSHQPIIANHPENHPDRQLEAELKEKELLLREIHHRIKNNLQVISSLLDLQAQRIKTPEIVVMFQESQHRIRTMALIHERLCQSSEFSQIDIEQYIQSLMDYLQRSYVDQLAKIKIHLHTQPTYLDVDRAIPCGLIVNELITNSFKHAFPDDQSGNIKIELEPSQEQVILKISNDGVPFPGDFNISGFQTLGLQLVNVLVQQLDGSIELEPSNGTQFTIKFPVT